MSWQNPPLLHLSAMFLTLSAFAGTAAAQQPLGEFTDQGDVGHVSHPGSASYDKATGTYTISGSGANIWARRDAFHYVWRKMKGDFILTARGELEGKGVEAHRKFGWMIRSGLDSNSTHVSAVVHGDGLTSLQFRRATGDTTGQVQSPIKGANVIQLERRGDVYIMSVAKYGDTLSTVQTTNVPLGDDVYVGLFVCAHNDTVTERAALTDVRITVPAKSTFVPYRDYIGSNVEIMEVATGHRRIVHHADNSIQAPNWTRDGKALIYNQGGKLYRFDLATNTPTEINTGERIRNNNDHVISFDGKYLGISDQTAEGGKSVVYTMPIHGGTPVRITAQAPSYLHGWSPDGKYLIYTGIRGTATDIYRMAVAGGTEEPLTQNAGMNDGSEYAPDGRIYFNSTRSGNMQIWRMQGDGRSPTQLTNDPFNNWFPHVAPDGGSFVYIAFPADINPTDHPWYKHVYLRQMSTQGGGGPSKVLAYLYGGQGTINVPSWSPDGKFVAFVSNTDAY